MNNVKPEDQNYQLNLSTARARKARAGSHFSQQWLRYVIWLLCLSTLVFSGYYLFIEGSAAGYLLALPLSVWLSIWIYWALNLKELPAPKPGASVSQRLEQDLLANLHSASLESVVSALDKTFGAKFLSVRFGISNKTIVNLLDASGINASNFNFEPVLKKAAQINNHFAPSQPSTIKSIEVAVSLLSFTDNSARSQVLAQLGLDDSDIQHALEWFYHLEGLINKSKESNKSGGLGRDLSFGYTPLLSTYATNISGSIGRSGNIYRKIEGNQHALDQALHNLSAASRLNVALVGKVGVGKTNLVWNIAETILHPDDHIPSNLKYRQVFTIDPSTLIANAKGGAGALEDIVIRIFNEAIKAKNVIIFLDDAELFLSEGTGKIDLSGMLTKVLESSGLQLILAMSDQAWLQLTSQNPGVAGLINRINLQEHTEQESMLVAQDQIPALESKLKVKYMFQTLKRAVELATRFISDEAAPGKVIKLLEAAAGYADADGFVSAQSVESAIEHNFGVKVQTATSTSSTSDNQKLLNLEEHIHTRMINQSHAVKVVSDALRRARAGVRNTRRPVGTFLFIGPTGVGKTQLAKSLAATYFSSEGSEDSIVRIDMNEYSQESDVARLLAPASDNPNSLTAQISKSPYSVVLLDELEKAHPNVRSVLLQMLDEGILRDASNKEVSFRESIVIATSNAGAQYIHQFLEEHGTDTDAMQKLELNLSKELISQGIFSPEFINRFDEVVTFRALDTAELAQVVEFILEGVNESLANQKLKVALDSEAIALLVEQGNDPLFGARPMRRIVQKSVENILAEKILKGEATPGTTIKISSSDLADQL